MEITQIQGQDIGNRITVPMGQNIPMPVLGAQGAMPQIQNQNGQTMIIPHPDLPVAINNQPISQPTPIQHGDTVTVNHGMPNPTLLAVHTPGQKLSAVHVGDFVKKAGLNLKEEQVLAIVQEIENVEKEKFKTFIVILSIIIVGLLFVVGFLWFTLSEKAETSTLDKTLSSLKKQLKTIETKQKDTSKISPEEIKQLTDRMTLLEEKIKATETQTSQLDADTKKQIEDVLKTVQQYSTDIQGMGAVQERIKAFEDALQNTPAGQQVSQAHYYDELQKQCGSNECCLNSVKTMTENSYKIAENNTCPQGEKINRLQCLDSYTWCIPENTTPSQDNSVTPSASTDSTTSPTTNSDAFLQDALNGNQ